MVAGSKRPILSLLFNICFSQQVIFFIVKAQALPYYSPSSKNSTIKEQKGKVGLARLTSQFAACLACLSSATAPI
jgi:hypothetical protein